MKEYFEVYIVAGEIDVLWYKGNNFTEAVKSVDDIKNLDKNAAILFVYNEKSIVLN